jgi:uncharacterized protein
MTKTALATPEEPRGPQVETREYQVADMEVRSEGDGMTFVGYGAVFDSPSQPLPFVERIAPGAFTRTLASRNNVKLFHNHNTDHVLGTTRAGTLRLTEDNRGLKVEADLPPTTMGNDLSILLKRGDIDSMSFGFHVPPGGDEWSSNGNERTLKAIALHEVSIVSGFPAYEGTSASVRMLALAHRTGLGEDALSDAFSALQSGADLTDDQFTVLAETVERLRPAALEPEADPAVPVDVLLQKLDLIAKAI